VAEAVFKRYLTERSANAFPFGDRTGVRIASLPLALNTSSNDAVNFVSRSRTRKGNLRPASSRSEVKLPATWMTQAMAGLAVTPRGERRGCPPR